MGNIITEGTPTMSSDIWKMQFEAYEKMAENTIKQVQKGNKNATIPSPAFEGQKNGIVSKLMGLGGQS